MHLKAFGLHNVSNALAAAAALLDSVPLAIIKEGLAAFRPYKGRFQLERLGEFTLVDDSYNANPASMKAALETLAQIAPEGHRVALLGDMLELGGHEAEAHEGVGAVAGRNVDRLYSARQPDEPPCRPGCHPGRPARQQRSGAAGTTMNLQSWRNNPSCPVMWS